MLKHKNFGYFSYLSYSESLWNPIKISHVGHMHPIIAPASRPETVGTVKFVDAVFSNICQNL